MTLEKKDSTKSWDGVNPKKLILHTQDGAIPYLTPHLLQTYFSPETNHLVRNHLILGIPIKDTSVAPTFEEKKEKKTAPTGYVFQPVSVYNRLRILPGYTTMILPTFDLLDDFDSYHSNNDARIEKGMQSKKRKHNRDPEGEKEDEEDVCILTASSAQPSSNAATSSSSSTLIIHSHAFCSNKQVSLVTPHGIHKITPQQYVHIASQSSPLISTVHHPNQHVVGLFDQLQGNEGEKRRKTWIQRMISWTSLLMNDKTNFSTDVEPFTSLQPQVHKSPSIDEVERLWIPMDIHLTTSEQKLYIQSIQQQNMVPLHFAIVGWHRMKNVTRTQRRDILIDRLNHLQSLTIHNPIQNDSTESSFMSAILCTQDITQLLDAMKCGVTWVGSDLPQRWAKEGKAICLFSSSTEPKSEIIETNLLDVFTKGQAWMMDLNDDRFMRDREPLIPGCRCLACNNRIHSRAYIHHLIQAHELLAQILLFGHNLHQMLLLMEQLTYFDSLGRLNEFCSSLEQEICFVEKRD